MQKKVRICPCCKKEKLLSGFHKDNNRKSGVQVYCKLCQKVYLVKNHKKAAACQKRWRDKNPGKAKEWRIKNPEKYRGYKLKYHYGLSTKDWDKMFDKQQGCCAICGIHQSQLKRVLNVDHNHLTGKIRELLCYACNLLVGKVEREKNLLDKISKYLKKHNEILP